MAIPSSHTSDPVLIPSQQIGAVQTEVVPTAPEHYQPFSGPEQSNWHFMKSSMAIPSSQASLPAQIPSLQVVIQVEGVF